MNFKRMLSGAAALVLAGAGVLVTGSSAQAAEIDDDRVQGPYVASSHWSLGAPPYIYELTWLAGGIWRNYDIFGQVFVTDLQSNSWKYPLDKGVDIVSLPKLGTQGLVRFESGPKQGLCFAPNSSTHPATNMVDIGACTENNAKWRLVEMGLGWVLQWDDSRYLNWYSRDRAELVNASELANPASVDKYRVDMLNPTMFSEVKKTVADPTAAVDSVDGSTAYIIGTGEPGATITITAPDGAEYPGTVRGDGTWGPVEVPGLPVGSSTLPVRQTVDGQPAGETSVDVTVAAPVTPLVAADDTAAVEQGDTVTIDVLGNDTGDGPLTLSGVTQPEHGSVAIVDGEVAYTADADFQGLDSFTYEVKDANGGTAIGTVTVTVAAKVDVPLMAPAFALGGLVLAGAGLGVARRKTARA